MSHAPLSRTARLAAAGILVLAAACKSDSEAPPVPSIAEKVGGDGVSGTVAAATSTAPTVKVTDDRGRPVANVVVSFAVATGGGSLLATADTTDRQGLATAGSWTLGTTAGQQTVTADIPRIEGAQLVFTATATPASPARLRFTQQPPTGVVAQAPIQPAMIVDVEDQYGNRVPGANTNVTLGLVSAPPDASILGTTQVSAVNGRATFGDIALQRAGMDYRFGATASGLSGTSSSAFTVNAGAPVQGFARAGDGQVALAGAAVAVRPEVEVRDVAGNVVAGATVVFTVVSGGGSVTGATTTTNTAGRAQVGSWTLGSTPGTNSLRADAGAASASFSATAITAADPASIVAVSGDNQLVQAGSALASQVVVRVLNAAGSPVANAPVQFTLWSGGGVLTGTSVNSDAQGNATLGSWTTGSAFGVQEVRVTAGQASRIVTARAFPASSFDIDIRYLDTPTARQDSAFRRSVRRWRQFIASDVPNVNIPTGQFPAGTCGAGTPAIEGAIDDLVIYVRLQNIDGAGNVLGSAGPCIIRGGTPIPAVGVMTFDTSDLAMLDGDGRLDDVILHEMGHVLGVGSMWRGQGSFNLLADTATNPVYTGAGGRAGYGIVNGTGSSANNVPVENTGGAGTRLGHWREATFGRELMTGFVSAPGQTNPFSAMTARSLADMGYTVSDVASDLFSTAGAALLAGPGRPAMRLEERGLDVEIRVWDEAARRAVPLSQWTAPFDLRGRVLAPQVRKRK